MVAKLLRNSEREKQISLLHLFDKYLLYTDIRQNNRDKKALMDQYISYHTKLCPALQIIMFELFLNGHYSIIMGITTQFFSSHNKNKTMRCMRTLISYLLHFLGMLINEFNLIFFLIFAKKSQGVFFLLVGLKTCFFLP